MLCIITLILLAGLAMGAIDQDLQTKFETMPRHEFIEYFNKQNHSFTIKDYGDNLPRACGVLMDHNHIHNFPIQRHDPRSFKDLPDNFDSREKWPECHTIKEIYEQGACGSCWAFGTANTASDRTCIHKDVHVHLAEQDFECLDNNVCGGGIAGDAFKFWRDEGLVTQECKPYNITKLKKDTCKYECVNKSIDYARDKHYAEKVYAVLNDTIDHIKAELFNNGPIQAGFITYDDFYHYDGGIYEHKFGYKALGHSVRVIGYGVENNVHYWLAANTYGYRWGEKGLFRVKAFTKDLEFESELISGLPKS